jgi:hypothetical protein
VFRQTLVTLAADNIKCYCYSKTSYFKNKCLNLASVNKVSKEPLKQEEEEEEDTKEADKDLKGNGEA